MRAIYVAMFSVYLGCSHEPGSEPNGSPSAAAVSSNSRPLATGVSAANIYEHFAYSIAGRYQFETSLNEDSDRFTHVGRSPDSLDFIRLICDRDDVLTIVATAVASGNVDMVVRYRDGTSVFHHLFEVLKTPTAVRAFFVETLLTPGIQPNAEFVWEGLQYAFLRDGNGTTHFVIRSPES